MTAVGDSALLRELEHLREENARLSRLLELRGAETTPVAEQPAMPLAAPGFDGLLIQCVGRVVRTSPGKDVAEVHDYHDVGTPILASTLRRRLPGYRALGFTKASDGKAVLIPQLAGLRHLTRHSRVPNRRDSPIESMSGEVAMSSGR